MEIPKGKMFVVPFATVLKIVVILSLLIFAEPSAKSALIGFFLLEILVLLSFAFQLKRWIAVILFSLLNLNFTAICLELVCFHLTGESFSDSFYFHFRANSIYFLGPNLNQLLLCCVAISIFCLANVMLFWVPKNIDLKFKKSASILLPLMIIGWLFISSALKRFVFGYLEFQNFIESPFDENALGDLGLTYSPQVGPPNVKRRDPNTPPNNLVVLFAESLEQVFFDEKVYPGLLPRLSKIRSESLQLNNLRQAKGTGWTIAGMFASQCSYPLEVLGGRVGIGEILDSNDSSHITCLGDFLSIAQYEQRIVQGTSVRFAGIDNFIASHGALKKFDVADFNVPDSDRSDFGVRDRVVLRKGLEYIGELSRSGRNYALDLVTIDTHFPGDPDPNCPAYENPRIVDPVEKNLLNSVHCLDGFLADFIERATEIDPNLVVAVQPDHLMQGNVPKWKNRSLYSFIVGQSIIPQTIENGTHFDIGPTLLAAIGLSTDFKFTLGSNLLIEKSKLFDHVEEPLKAAYLYLKSKLNETRHKELTCESGISFDAKNEQLVLSGLKIRTGDILFQNDMALNKWPDNKFLYIRLDSKRKILKSEFFYSSDRVNRLLLKYGGVVVGNIGRIPILCSDEVCEGYWGIASASSANKAELVVLPKESDFQLSAEVCEVLLRSSYLPEKFSVL